MDKESSTGGVGFCGLLLAAFIVMKLAKIGTVADWSWWWVTSPFWIPIILAIPLVILTLWLKQMQRNAENKIEAYRKEHFPERKSKFLTRLDEMMEKKQKK